MPRRPECQSWWPSTRCPDHLSAAPECKRSLLPLAGLACCERVYNFAHAMAALLKGCLDWTLTGALVLQIDKEGANIDRVKQEMSENGLLPEEWGGETPMVAVCAP